MNEQAPRKSVDLNTYSESIHGWKTKSFFGLKSLFGRQVAERLFSFLAGIILARILMPEAFGIYSIVSFFVQFFSAFGDVGIGAALIQKKENLTQVELSSIFWLQQILVLTVSIVIFFISPLSLKLYSTLPESAIWLIRAMAVSFFLSSLKTIPAILLERNLDFSPIVLIELIEQFFFQVGAIVFAWLGFDVWSFILASLLRAFVGVFMIFIYSPWKPSFNFSFSKIKHLVAFGLPFQGNGILSLVKDSVTPLFVGAFAGGAAVGYINFSRNLAFFPLLISKSFSRVAFPAFSRIHHEKELFAKAIEKSIRMLNLIILPITGFLLALGPAIIKQIFTEKWLPGLPAFYFYCTSPLIVGILLPMHSALLSLGRSKIVLKITILLLFLEWGLGVPFVIYFGFNGIALSQPIIGCVLLFWYAEILKSEGIFISLVNTAGPQLLYSAVSFALLKLFCLYAEPGIPLLGLLVFLGSALYLALVNFFRNDLLMEFKNFVFSKG